MTNFRGISLLLILAPLICCCGCDETLTSVIQRLNQFDRKLHHNKKEILGVEENVLNLIEFSKTALRAELKENIRDHVRQAMFEIIHGDSLQDIVKGEVVSELKHLKRGYHQMKRQMHHFSKSLMGLQDKMDVFQQSWPQKAYVSNGRDSCDMCVRDKQRLEIELYKCNVTTADLKTDIDRMLAMNENCQSEISELKQSLAVHASPGSVQDVNTTSSSPVSTSVTTPIPPQLTTSVTTARPSMSITSMMTVRPEEKRSRILIAPLWSYTMQQFRQLNIHINSISVYQNLTVKRVSCVAYIANTQKLLIGLEHPNKVLSSTLDTSYTAVVKEGVQAYGMAVDEEQDIVFMTTVAPQYAISRMSTQGNDFNVITARYPGMPAGITLDKKRKKIYACSGVKVFILTYDGQGLATLAQGTAMHAVILDHTAGVLYYNNEKKLMKMTVSSNVSAEVTTLDVIPSSMSLYRGTIYYGSRRSVRANSGSIGAVDVSFNSEPHILKSVPMDMVFGLVTLLIP